MSKKAQPVRIAITGDLHYDSTGYLTSPKQVEELAQRIQAENPAALIIAGDIAHGLGEFERCMACFEGFDVPVGVVAGNHDVWRDQQAGHSSAALWNTLLPKATRDAGAIWLEEETLRLGDVVIVGSMVWYDYSAIDPAWTMSEKEIASFKALVNNDAHWIDWQFTDPMFANLLGAGLRHRLELACLVNGVRTVVVVTHVPIIEEQIVRKPGDLQWGISNAYFGNLTTGKVVLAEPKVCVIASAHTHVGRQGVVKRDNGADVAYYVVPSDYGAPAYIMIEV